MICFARSGLRVCSVAAGTARRSLLRSPTRSERTRCVSLSRASARRNRRAKRSAAERRAGRAQPASSLAAVACAGRRAARSEGRAAPA